jgi:transposase-like protein
MRLKRSKLGEKQSVRLLEHFVAGTPARTAADLVGVNKNAAVLYYHRLREIIAARVEDESPISGEVEIDESYFGGYRRGKRGRAATGKVPVFGILKRGGRVYTKMIIVVFGICGQRKAQMPGVEDNVMVKALTPDRADQPFDMAVLQERTRPCRSVAHAHRTQDAPERSAIEPIIVAHQVERAQDLGEPNQRSRAD